MKGERDGCESEGRDGRKRKGERGERGECEGERALPWPLRVRVR